MVYRMRGCLFLIAACLTGLAMAHDSLPPIDAGLLRSDISYLADDRLQGRATATRGYELAARYVSEQMQEIGLEPAGSDGGWLQPVPMVQSTPVARAARATIRREGADTELSPTVDFVPLPSHRSQLASVAGPLVFVGYGVSAPEAGYDDLTGLDLAGKVAVVLPGLPPAIPQDKRVHYSKEKLWQIAGRGAAGIVQLTPPAEADRGSWERTVTMTRVPSLRRLDEAGRPQEAPVALEAGITLSAKATSELLVSAPKPLEAIWADAEAGVPQAFHLPASINVRTYSVLRTVESPNVVGVLAGSDPKLRNEYVVLMAHLDHLGTGVPGSADTIYNGALDNASGVAVMLATARTLAAAPARPRRSILFLAVTAEERGLLGSRHFATHPTVPRESIVAVVNLDMPVALYPAAGYTVIGAEHSSLGEVARRALEAEGLRALPNQAPERGLFALADQYSFVQERIPALYLHDGPVSADPAIDANKVFDDYLSQHYHQPSDQIDLPIHWESLARFARVHVRLCLDIANANERPAWVPGDFYGERFGKR